MTRLAIAVVGVGIFAGALMLDRCDGDPRPLGTIDDVLALRERDGLNVLFILVDTLRADHLSSYGYGRPTSPRIDALAESGVRFAHHVSQSSWTKCSMASLWTGLYPSRSGVLRSTHVLTEDALMPAEIFRDAGFHTAGIWRNGWIAPNFGFSQGFLNYTQPRPTPRRHSPHERPNLSLLGSDSDLIRSAHAFLHTYADQRWFLYLHLMDVHQYVSSPEEAIFGTSYLDIYDNSILWTDGLIGHLLDEIDALGLRDRTLVIFASDHGEAFGEHDGEGHARNVYAEVTETPFILSFPFRLEPGIVVETRSENVDLWTTVLDLLGLPSLLDPDGRTLLPDIEAAARGERHDDDGTAIALLDQTWGRDHRDPELQVAVNRGSWRLVYSSARPQRPELFDKDADPREQRNLASQQPEVLEPLIAIARGHVIGSDAPWGGAVPNVEIDEMQADQLRALGYGVE